MDHPLVRHKIDYIRRKEVGTKEFREMIEEIAMMWRLRLRFVR